MLALKIAILLLIVYLVYRSSEPFANKTNKAKSNYDWFAKHGANATYTQYRQDFGNDANIVDYEAIRKLAAGESKKFNVGQVIQRI